MLEGLIVMFLGLLIVAIGDSVSISRHFKAADFIITVGVIIVIIGLMALGFGIYAKWYA
ncbi:hypothetical protein ME799_07390 [Lactobacillus delbrueckii]|nr:hypothetical protein ME799_07390 [Lactobacillus delbrueckii]